MKRSVLYWVGGGSAIWTVLAAIIGWSVIPVVVDNKIAETVAVTNGSEAFDRWQKLPVPMKYKVSLFEVMNPDEILRGEIPIVEERGPYVYDMWKEKSDIEIFEDEDRATYYETTRFEFNGTDSHGTDEDELTLVNTPAFGFAHIAESIPGLKDSTSMFNKVVKFMWPDGNPLFVKRKVRDYLFEGIKMDCTANGTSNIIEKFMWKFMCLSYDILHARTVTINADGQGTNLFSLFGYKQNTSTGPYEVRLGIKTPEDIGQILTFQNKTDLGIMWGGSSCNKIRGTDSTIFRPYLSDVDNLTVFNVDIYRSVDLFYDSDITYKDVPGRRYVSGKKFFGNVFDYPENYCYCPRSVKGTTVYGGCLKDGLMDVSSCQGAPLFLSYPHLLMAHPEYHNQTQGLSPDPEKHTLFVDLETNTGYPLRGASRTQFNILTKKIKNVDCMRNLRGSLMPVFWLEQGVELSDDLVDEIKDRLLNVLKIVNIVKWILLAIGLVGIGASGVLLFISRKKSESV